MGLMEPKRRLFLHKWLRVPYQLNIRYVQRPENSRATFLFVHGLGDTGDVWAPTIAALPSDSTAISIDLLGFGDSPKPSWKPYDLQTQVKLIRGVCARLKIADEKLILVGHSLGSLIAIAYAQKYRKTVASLVLCSPPIYRAHTGDKLSLRAEDILRRIYEKASQRPQDLIKLYAFAQKYGLANKSLAVTDETVTSFVGTLQASIINQQIIDELPNLELPTTIIHGVLDPFVVGSNLKTAAKRSEYITLKNVPGTHIIRGTYAKKLSEVLLEHLEG